MNRTQTLSIDDFARCVAKVRQTGDVEAALGPHGQTAAAWSRLKAEQLEALSTPQGRAQFTRAYQAAMGIASNEPPPTRIDVDETGMVAAPDELRRLILEADPRYAIPRGPRPAPRSSSFEQAVESGETVLLPAPDELRELRREASDHDKAGGRS